MPVTFDVATDKKLEKVKFERNLDLPSKKLKKLEIIAETPVPTDKSVVNNKNGFVNAIVTAYNKHHHLIIRPDDVWLAIMVQFSAYVQKNAETLRKQFVSHTDKKELVIFGDGNLLTADYKTMTTYMSSLIAENIIDDTVKDWVLPGFSTTTDEDLVAGAIVLMSSMSEYFSFRMVLFCGIPRVTLLGTVDDWKLVKTKAERLSQYDADDHGLMTKWSEILLPVLDQLIKSAEGEPDVDWWNKVCCHLGQGSGPRYLSGWITAFCVFNDSGEWVGNKSTDPKFADVQWPMIDTNDIPCGSVTVPVCVNDNGVLHRCEMSAGHTTIAFQGTSIEPRISWNIHKKPTPAKN